MAILVKCTLLTAFGISSVLYHAFTVSNRFSTTERSVNCDHRKFEAMTFVNNTKNRQELSQAFYPPYGHLPYSVIVDYKSIDVNGSEISLLSTPSCAKAKLIWFYSIIFVFMRPEFLNKLSLYTLNYFEEWKPHKIAIFVPYPCSNVTKKVLLQMTSSVSTTLTVLKPPLDFCTILSVQKLCSY